MSRKKALLCCLPPTFIVPFNLPDASQPASTQHTEVQDAASIGYHIPDSPVTAQVSGHEDDLDSLASAASLAVDAPQGGGQFARHRGFQVEAEYLHP